MRRMNTHEKIIVRKVLDGKLNPNTRVARDVLSRPHVAITFECILDQAGLTDKKLSKKVSAIINRKSDKVLDKNDNVIKNNQTTVDANALQAIRTIWQVKGKFVEKKEVHHSGAIAQATDEYLDGVISQGMRFLGKKKETMHADDKIQN